MFLIRSNTKCWQCRAKCMHCLYTFTLSLIRKPALVGKALSFTHKLSFLSFFHQSTVLSSHAVDSHQMYVGDSFVDKARTVGIEISPTPPLIFHNGVKKCEIWRRFEHHSTLRPSRLKTQQDIRMQKQTSCVGMIALCLCQARISCRRSNFVKIIPEPSATRNAMFKVIRSNTEIAITLPRNAHLRSNLEQCHHVTGDTLRMFKVKGQVHSVN